VSAPVADRLAGGLRAHTVPLRRDLDLVDLAGEHGFLWRSGRHELVAHGVAGRVLLDTGPGRLVRAAQTVEALLDAIETERPPGAPGPLATGALPFSERSHGELVVPELVVRRGRDGELWKTRVTHATADRARLGLADGGGPPEPAIAAVRPLQDRAGWDWAVAQALKAIEAGRLDKVVLAREVIVEADGDFSRKQILRRLRLRADGCLLYADGGFVGASPELLVRRDGLVAGSCPLAGTVARAASADEDAARIARLAASAKDAAEHRFVVDAVASALAPVSEQVTVHEREIVRLATVAHLATRIEASLREPAPSALGLAALLHPTPAVAGTPTPAALALLAELEPFQRGHYGGPVGWVDADGDGEWAVALRGAELDGPRARLIAGAGIVAGSEAASEWAETEAKLGAMLDVLGAPG
jgi:menaquinone-specific isochorismate synthase